MCEARQTEKRCRFSSRQIAFSSFNAMDDGSKTIRPEAEDDNDDDEEEGERDRK